MKIYTSYLSFVLKHDLLNNVDYFPISIMRFKPSWFKEQSAELKQLAPSKDLLLAWKQGDVIEVEYEKQFQSEVLRRYSREDIEDLIVDNFPQAEDRIVVLYCVCGPNKFCHRNLLGNMYDFPELRRDDIY